MKKTTPQIAKSIADLIWPEFVVVDDGVFLRFQWKKNRFHYHKDALSESESFINHTHILDRLKHKAGMCRSPFFKTRHPDFALACQIGKSICHSWAAKLATEFPDQRFRVYYHGFDPIVRFHKVRPNQPNFIESTDFLKEIAAGDILILETKNKAQPGRGAQPATRGRRSVTASAEHLPRLH